MRCAVIANPVSGRRGGVLQATAALTVLRRAGWEAELLESRWPGHATELARDAAASGAQLVIAAGGDGTLSQIALGLRGTRVPLAPLPAGTGNDFCRAVGVSLEPETAAAQILRGHPRQIDLMCLNSGRNWAVNMVGTGFDARVTQRINCRSRRTAGPLAYLTAVAGELWHYAPTQLRVEVDGAGWEGPALLAAVANGVSYGAGMNIAPHAVLDDGLLDVVVVGYIPRLEFLRTFPRVFRGTHLSHPAVHSWRGRHVELHSALPSPVVIDGDVTCQTPLTADVGEEECLIWVP